MESTSTQDIINSDSQENGPRPPEPLPEQVRSDEDYAEPVELQHQASIAPRAFTQGPSPPDVPPPRKESATAAYLLEKNGECSGPQLLPECQNRGASVLWPPDITGKKGKSSHVISASPRRHPEDSTNATTRVKKSLAKSPSSPLPELRSPFSASTSQPAVGESQQFGSYSPVQLHRERSNSVILDIHGYVKL